MPASQHFNGAQQLDAWQELLPWILAAYTGLWAGVHLCSILICSPWLSRNNVKHRDAMLWHNRVVSVAHALYAAGYAVFWLLGTSEWTRARQSTFLFLPTNAHAAALGASYFIYDTLALCTTSETMKSAHFLSVLSHHLLFLSAYASTVVRSCYLCIIQVLGGNAHNVNGKGHVRIVSALLWRTQACQVTHTWHKIERLYDLVCRQQRKHGCRCILVHSTSQSTIYSSSQRSQRCAPHQASTQCHVTNHMLAHLASAASIKHARGRLAMRQSIQYDSRHKLAKALQCKWPHPHAHRY